MNKSAEASSTAARSFMMEWRRGASPFVLDEIADEDVNLVVWQRRGPAGVKRALSAWARRSALSFDEVLCGHDCDVAPLVASMVSPLRERMAQDIERLLHAFARVTKSACVRTTFDVVRTDRCRKFHADFVRYRLITTYIGPGTEWLPEEAVDRAAMVGAFECPFEANRAIVRPDATVQCAAAGEVLLMKGAAHRAARGAVHRSPPLTAAEPRRVLLTVSTVD